MSVRVPVPLRVSYRVRGRGPRRKAGLQSLLVPGLRTDSTRSISGALGPDAGGGGHRVVGMRCMGDTAHD